MRSPWVGGGTAAVASSSANAFPGFIAALPGIINALPTLTAAQKAALTGMLADLNPILAPLRPTPAQIGTLLFLSAPVAAADVRDIEPLHASFNNTWELGYKGLVSERMRVAVDFWYQIRGDVGTKIALANPLVLFDATSLGGYLTTSITQGLVARGQTQAQAQAAATAAVGALLPLMAAFPQGSIALNSRLTPDQSLIVTYFNASGKYRVHGLDLAIDYQPDSRWLLSTTYSYQNKIVFPEIGGAGNPLMSNTPKHRASASARFTGSNGVAAETHLRYADAFPDNSGYYNSATPNLYNPAFKPLSPVPAQVQLDLGVSYRFPRNGLSLGLHASNALNNRVPNFAGTPAIGRLVLTRLKYDF
jgi:iron complex outermembrane receptor protein